MLVSSTVLTTLFVIMYLIVLLLTYFFGFVSGAKVTSAAQIKVINTIKGIILGKIREKI